MRTRWREKEGYIVSQLQFMEGRHVQTRSQAQQPPPPPPPRGALEGKGPWRRPWKRLDRRLEEVAEAVGGGYCRLQMPLKLAIRETVGGHRLGAVEGGGVDHPPPQGCSVQFQTPNTAAWAGGFQKGERGVGVSGPTRKPPPRPPPIPPHKKQPHFGFFSHGILNPVTSAPLLNPPPLPASGLVWANPTGGPSPRF